MKGYRVVRGPNWKWGGQDGGEGCVGIVVGSAENAMMEKLNRFGALKGISELGGINSGTGLLDKLRQISTALGGEAGRSNIEEQISDLRRQTAGMVYVVWDSGTKANYRAGIRGLHDLRASFFSITLE